MSQRQWKSSDGERIAQLHIGTSGWDYDAWQGDFYPSDISEEGLLALYAEMFPSVEVNYSFYHLPEKDTFARWREGTPPDFLFAVKANRYLTHMKKLNDAAEPLQRFLDATEGLKEKLGVILFQLPPFWHADGPSPRKVTADFVYLRFHGPQGEYRAKYGEKALGGWEEKIREWRRDDLDVYAYFNNTAHGHAIEDAQRLKDLVSY